MPFPWTRTTRFSHPFATQNYTRGRLLYNDMTYTMIDMALWTGTSKQINRFRRNVLGLPPTTLERLELWRVPHIYSFSASVLPPPKDWPDYVHCTGYWFLDNPDKAWHPDPAFLAFLDAPDERPIVYIGFGSIVVPDPEAVSATIVEAVLRANVRAIICKGWSSRMQGKGKTAEDVESSAMLDRHPGTIYSIDAVPHDWLFPRIQGVVHHGGAGTTAAGLRAGLPTIVKPFFGDQRFWGQRLEDLGVGLCLVKLTVDRLADAIRTITQNKVLVHKAAALGETLRQVKALQASDVCSRSADSKNASLVAGDGRKMERGVRSNAYTTIFTLPSEYSKKQWKQKEHGCHSCLQGAMTVHKSGINKKKSSRGEKGF